MKSVFCFILLIIFLIDGRRILHRLQHKGVFNVHEHTISDFDVPEVLSKAATSVGAMVQSGTFFWDTTLRNWKVPTQDPFNSDFRPYLHRHAGDPASHNHDVAPTSPGSEKPLCPVQMNFNPRNISLFQASDWACSGFLVSPNLFVTAGHCFDVEDDCRNFGIVINFKPRESHRETYGTSNYRMTKTVSYFDSDRVYRCKKVIDFKLEEPNWDYAVIQLDRDVDPFWPFVEVQPSKTGSGAVKTDYWTTNRVGMNLAGFAHPNGLSELYDPDGTITHIRNGGKKLFGTVDGEQGSSGALVVNRDNGLAIGIQVAGPTGWILRDRATALAQVPQNQVQNNQNTLQWTECWDRLSLNCSKNNGADCPFSEMTEISSTEQWYEFIDHKPIKFPQALAKVSEKQGSARIKALQKLVGMLSPSGTWDSDTDASIVTLARATNRADEVAVTEDNHIIPGPPTYPNITWTGYSVSVPLISMWLCEFKPTGNGLNLIPMDGYYVGSSCTGNAIKNSVLAVRELLKNGYTAYTDVDLAGDNFDETLVAKLKEFAIAKGYESSDWKGLDMGLWRHLWNVEVNPPTWMPDVGDVFRP